MAVIVRGAVPADEFALNHVLATVPAVEFEVERIVKSGEDAVMPLVWARETDEETLEDAMAADTSVEDAALLASFEDEALYRMQWIERVHLLLQMITNAEATVLDAYGRGDQWDIRVLYPNRDRFSRTHDFCGEHGLTFDVEAIRELDGEPAGRYGLSKEQYRSLVTAVERGYFEVPRETSLQELSDEMDISHQALSERLRRGTEALVEDALMVGVLEDEDLDDR